MTTGSDDRQPGRWLTNARIVDVRSGRVSALTSLEIRDDRIAGIGGPPPPGAEVLVLDGGYLLPGLITCHVHLQGTYPYSTRDPNEPPPWTALRASARARQLRVRGFTTVRSVHELNRADLQVRHAAEMGWTEAPRIFGAGRALTRPGGHGDGFGAVTASGAAGFHDAAAAELEAGADHVKIFASGGLAKSGEALDGPELSLAEMRGAVTAAEERGTYVVAHAADSATIRLALEAGVRSFEHGYLIDSDTAAAMAAAGAFLTPTLVVTHAADWMRATGFDEAAITRSTAFADRHVASARRAIEAGVAIVHGTDIPSDGPSDGTMLAVRELELLVASGATTLAALQSANLTAAKLLGREGELGEIVEGAVADFIMTLEDPTASVRALRSIAAVFQAGEAVTPVGAGPGRHRATAGGGFRLPRDRPAGVA